MVITKNFTSSFLNLASFLMTCEIFFFTFWKEWAYTKLTTSAIGQNKDSYREKNEKVVFVKILKANFRIFIEKVQVYRGCHSIRDPRIYPNQFEWYQ